MGNFNSENLFNLVFIFVTTIALGLLLGLSVLRTVDQRLSDVKINIPEIKIPEPKVNVQLPAALLKALEREKNTCEKKEVKLTSKSEYPTLILKDEPLKQKQKEGSSQQKGGTQKGGEAWYSSVRRGKVDPCYRFSSEGSCQSYYSDSASLQEHPDFSKGYRRNHARERTELLTCSQALSERAGRIIPRHPKRADCDPIAQHSLSKDVAENVNQPETHQFVRVSSNERKGHESIGHSANGTEELPESKYLDRPWEPDQHYKAPIDMTEKQRIKFMLTAKFDKMTPIDYRNWLLLYRDSREDLAPYHCEMLQKVLNGYQITRDDLPRERHHPKSAEELYRLRNYAVV